MGVDGKLVDDMFKGCCCCLVGIGVTLVSGLIVTTTLAIVYGVKYHECASQHH